jgi:hypothetical protein
MPLQSKPVLSLAIFSLLLTVPVVTANAASAKGAMQATASRVDGSYAVEVDLEQATAQDLPGGRCLLTVPGTAAFTGDLTGDATGTTEATVLAPCSDAVTSPPGTYRDTFTFKGSFVGSAPGTDDVVAADLVYSGTVAPGGAIKGTIRLRSDSVRATLTVSNAVVAEGGDYGGTVSVR